MWSWSFEGTTRSWGQFGDKLGDVDGDLRDDVTTEMYESSDGRGGVLAGGGIESWPARGPAITATWSDNFPEWKLSGPLPGGDVNGDGYDDIWVMTDSAAGYVGGAFLMLGREGGFGEDIHVVDEAADAMWLDSSGPELTYAVGHGEFTGDGFADIIVRPNADGDTMWSLIAGGSAPSGRHSFAELESVHIEYDASDLVGGGQVFRDLDGDGFDELGHDTRRTHDGAGVVTFLEGESLQDGAWFVDVGADAWLEGSGAIDIRFDATNQGESGDIDGDGLLDALLWRTTQRDAGDTYDVGLFSGAVASGEFSELETVTVCPADGGYLRWGGWQDDVDDDGIPDVQVLSDRGWTTLPSTRLREGGVQLLDDIAGPTTYWGTYFRATADFNGDGLPEWVYADNYWDDPNIDDEFVRSLILTGFEIPWDDPAKW